MAESAAGAGEKSAESLKILIPFITIGRAAVQIGAVVIHLPDFDEHISQRFSVTVEYSTGEMSYFTDGGRDRVIDDNQVIIRVQRQVIGIEGAFGLLRRSHQILGEGAGSQKMGCGDGGGGDAEIP